MPNGIQHTTGSTPIGCLRKGNILIANNLIEYGTSFFSGITPPSGGYSLYLNKASGGPSIYCPSNDAQLIDITNKNIAGTVASPANYTTAAQCLDYFAGQTDKLATNFDYPNVVTSSSLLNVDAGFVGSYPTTASTWYDISGNSNNGTLINSPIFTSANSGSFIFDGVDDFASAGSLNLQQNFTLTGWYKPSVLTGFAIFGQGTTAANVGLHIWYIGGGTIRFGMFANDTDFTVSTSVNNWYYIACTYNNSSPFTKQLYINGVAQTGTPAQAQSAYIGTGILRLGATYSSGGNYASGSFAYMAMYNRILSSTEITQNYNALKGRFGL
jgi:hypothetical protein